MKTPHLSTVQSAVKQESVTEALEKFCAMFNQLDKGNLDQLKDVYSRDIQFQDPFGQVSGLEQLTEYMAGAYGNVLHCQFRFSDPVMQQQWCTIPWVMELRHKRIRNGKTVFVDGISHLRIRDGKVCYHRDYFDAGQLLYENLPVVGGAIRWVKRQAG